MTTSEAGKLETERLILRPLTVNDFEAVHSWGSNPINTRYMAWGPNSEELTKKSPQIVRIPSSVYYSCYGYLIP